MQLILARGGRGEAVVNDARAAEILVLAYRRVRIEVVAGSV